MEFEHHDQVWPPDDIIAFVGSLPGVVAVTASEADGAPEIAWGDTFFFYDPNGDGRTSRRMPFATIVTKDYDGFDTASDLNQPGAFRLSIAVGRAAFEELIGYPPATPRSPIATTTSPSIASSPPGLRHPGMGGHREPGRDDHRPGRP